MTVKKAVSLTQVIVPLLLLLLYPALPFAAEYYVDGTTGSDASDGSSASPWKTIGYALTPGPEPTSGTDTIYIRYATYKESLNLLPIDKRSLTIKGVAQDGKMPIIDGNGVPYTIELTNFNGTIQGLEITGATENGVNIAGESTSARIIGCKIHGNKKGIHVTDTSTPLISGNSTYSNSECGIANMADSSATIDGNLIYENGNGSAIGPSAGICIPGNSTPKIYNNIIRNNYNSGINILDYADPMIVNNTIIHHRGTLNSPGRAIKVVHSQATPIQSITIANNIIYDNDSGLFSQEEKIVTGNDYNNFRQNDENYFGFAAGSHEIFTDPLFTDSYNLNSTSLCIDAGTPANAPAKDIRGVIRPQGKEFDIGAYEYQEKDSGTSGQGSIPPVLFILL